jgi:uncharacterized Zn finger protein (UPF0148 family)
MPECSCGKYVHSGEVLCADCTTGLRARIATLEAQVEKAREALKKIEANAPSQYEPDAEYWEWGNYDDAYSYGLDTATMRCAQIATAALAELEGME